MFKISIFSKIYEACIGAARHKFASIFLAIFSFIESIFWPIPTDVVLAPMCLAKPNRALLYALNATVTSVLGAVVGYYIGYWLSTAFVKEFFESVNMIGTFNTVNEYLNEFGILFILIGAAGIVCGGWLVVEAATEHEDYCKNDDPGAVVVKNVA